MLLFLIADIMLLIEIDCFVIRLICELQPRVHVLHWVHAGEVHLGQQRHVFRIRGPLGGGMCRWQLCVVGISYLPTVHCLCWLLLPCGVDVGGRHRVRSRIPLPRWGQRQTRNWGTSHMLRLLRVLPVLRNVLWHHFGRARRLQQWRIMLLGHCQFRGLRG